MRRVVLQKTFRMLSRPFSVQQMQQWSGQKFVILLYHVVSDNPSPLVKHLYPVATTERFRRDLDFLLKNFEPAGIDEVNQLAVTKIHSGRPKFYLTFDDGLRECYTVVREILKERNVEASFFVNPAFIDNKALGHRQKVSLLIEAAIQNAGTDVGKEAARVAGAEGTGLSGMLSALKKLTANDLKRIDHIARIYRVDFEEALEKYKPYMSLSQVLTLVEDGFVVGSHSYSHPEFNRVSRQEMEEQVIRSFRFLDAAIGTRERTFSFPFHDIDIPLSFYQFLQNEVGVVASFGTSGLKHDTAPGNLQRIPMEVNGFCDAEAILRTEYFYYLAKSLLRKNRIIRK